MFITAGYYPALKKNLTIRKKRPVFLNFRSKIIARACVCVDFFISLYALLNISSHSFAMKTTKINISTYFAMLCAALFICAPMYGAFSLTHQTGAYNELQDNGMQSVHTDYQIMYAKPGETVFLYRPERATFVGYVRWYCYDTDRAIPATYSAEDSPTGVAIPRIQSTWSKDTLAASLKFKDRNEYGWFGYSLMGPAETGKATAGDGNFVEIKYTMHKGDSIYRIACDQGIWNNYSPATWDNNTEMTEPTLSKRTIYEIRPAAWMADSLENYYKVTPETPNDNYLEEHKMIAPTGRQLYIGPDMMCLGAPNNGTKVALGQYTYYALTNYYYINSQGNVTAAGDKSKWKWYKDGEYDSSISFYAKGAQFAGVSSPTPGTVVYTLKYNPSEGYFFNVARFTVTYMDVDEVGPSTAVPAPSKKMDKIYEENFNYNRPGTTDFAFWDGYYDVDESTYGYYTKNINALNRQTERNKITWSEYAVTNRKSVWVSSGTAPQVYQHVDGKGNEANNAKEGYMLYCDGSQNPGLVFNLKVNADLCPGSTMYFSAWLCDASSNGSGKSAPNMDFVVTGIDELGNEHALTTFTTGEFGINAVKKVGEEAKMERAKWYKIMFPVKFDAGDTYPSYRLRITNKSTSSDGNDFAIDDIRIYVQKPPVIPIQASTSDCIDKAVDSIRTYLRIDYQEIDHDGQPLYYQWREEDNVVHNKYYNIDGPNTNYGKVNIKPDANITASDTCSDLLSFDKKFRETEEPVVRYIWEEVAPEVTRYVMYIAMPMEVRINHDYTGFVALSPSGLGDRDGCGTYADMLVAGGTRITINDEITFGDSVVSVCGHRSYTLNIVLTKIIQDETQGELKIDTTHCKADWLIGDSAYVNAHPEIYKHSFDEIERGLGFYRQHVPSAIKMVNFLKNHSLLILDTAGITMNPGVSLTYTAFPLDGTAGENKVCTTPRFLKIQPADKMSNMMAVGEDDTEVLPDEVKMRPRIVRISNAQKATGSFHVPMYLVGDETESYEIEKVELISSTFEGWEPMELTPNQTTMGLKNDVIFTGGEDFKALEPGYDYTFHVAFEGESSEDKCDRGYTYFMLRIVPDVVTWQGGDWNLDANWDYFVPLDETNVILLSKNYNATFAADPDPVESYDFNFKQNECNNIYIPADASMANQQAIVINGIAYVDIPTVAQKWALTSIPIKGIVSGDLFVSQSESDDPFTVAGINHTGTGTVAADRYTYEVYNSEYDAENNTWLKATNTLTRPMLPGDASVIGIDCASAAVDPVIRLPKPDNKYHYYDIDSHEWLDEYEDISESLRADLGRPAWDGSATVTLNRAYNDIYMFGNPTFGYIDLTRLVADNSSKLTGKYYLAPGGVSDAPGNVSTPDEIDPLEEHVLLPPFRGVLLEGKSESDQLTINISTALVTPWEPDPIPEVEPIPAPKRRALQYDSPFNTGNGAPTGSLKTLIDEKSMTIDTELAPWLNKDLSTLNMHRELYRDGAYNTLCLPFDFSAAEIDASPLAGAELYEFVRATKVSDAQLDIVVSETTDIEAGVPYLIKWAPAVPEVIPMPITFYDVHIKDIEGQTLGESNEVQFVGSISRKLMVYEDHNNLFVGANNILYWPNTHNPLRGFRAYFQVPESGPAGVPKNTPARIVVQQNTTTGVDNVQRCSVTVKSSSSGMVNGTTFSAKSCSDFG